MLKHNILYNCLVMLLVLPALLSCDNNDAEPSTYEQLVKEMAAIDSYLATKGIEAYKDKRGIRFTITTMGTGGLPPRVEHTVKVNYTGRILATGEVFESKTTEGLLSSYIDGWKYALAIMPKGTVATVYIPSVLAYGKEGRGSVPPNSNLVFDMTLEDVKRSVAQQQRLTQDIQTIDNYLIANTITAVEDTTGLRYVITQTGTGDVPTWYNKVRIKYTGYVLGNSNSFYSGTAEPDESFDSRVVDYIHGFMVGLQKLPAGSKAVLYIPSGLGFGSQQTGNGAVPADANLKYEIELEALIE